jgi:hypothetical protein
MGDHDEGEARLGRHSVEELLEGLEAAGRRTDADDHQSSRWDRSLP